MTVILYNIVPILLEFYGLCEAYNYVFRVVSGLSGNTINHLLTYLRQQA